MADHKKCPVCGRVEEITLRDECLARAISRKHCSECGRAFNLRDIDDAGEWYFGHDCEIDRSWEKQGEAVREFGG